MSKKKKRASTALKSFGAAGLAAATIVSGLSFGPAAVASATTGPVSSQNSTQSGPVSGKVGSTTELARGGETTTYAVGRVVQAGTGNLDASVVFTAPEGTTFSAGQNTLNGEYWWDNGGWSGGTGYLRLGNGQRSADGKTYTYTWGTDSTPMDNNRDFRFGIKIATAANSTGTTGALTTKFTGTSSNGAFDATSSTPTHIPAAVAAPTADVAFDADVTKKATVSGTGANGATITLFKGDSTQPIGTARVTGGTWSTTIDPIGAGDQKIRVEQSGIEGVQTIETTAKYGAAVTLDDPASATVTPGMFKVTGTGQAGTTVTISGGPEPVTAMVDVNGAFSEEIELAPSHTATTLTAEQLSKGNLRTADTITVTPDGAQTAREVAITEPSSHTYKTNRETTVQGTATPYAKIELRFQWNDTVYGETRADKNGNWSIKRGFGPAARYELTATQTRFDGSSSASAKFTLDPEGISDQEIVITGPADHTYTAGEQTRITGTATPYATIELRFQWNNTVYGRAVANAEGSWNIVRAFGPEATYELTATQIRANGTTTDSAPFTISPENVDRPFALLTPAMSSTFSPGVDVSFTGTGTPDATITAIAPAWNNGQIFQTKVKTNGEWDIRRSFAAGITYDLTIIQEPLDGEPSSITGVHLTPTN